LLQAFPGSPWPHGEEVFITARAAALLLQSAGAIGLSYGIPCSAIDGVTLMDSN
jgi:hypothetical protein